MTATCCIECINISGYAEDIITCCRWW